MVQLFADGALVYDPRLDDYRLLGLKTTTGLNKGGTAEIVMRPSHPAYNSFTSYKTLVELYENGARRFRGRAIYPADDFFNRRTITCEGERCFLRDGIHRPYLYQDTPAAIFAAALELYNAQVDEWKRFVLGEVTVTDANDYVRLESSSAENFQAFFDKLVERCGGYITFTDTDDGRRAINWLAEIGTQSDQPIEFGLNLLEFARSGQSPDMATAIVPYGAQLEDGTRVTIESVTADGADWIKDEEAVALRGLIVATVTWDDVTDPANLLRKAQEWLEEHKLAITSLSLTAADLSRMGRNIGSYHVGDRVKVWSRPHGLDAWFQLTDRTIDWLDPAGGKIDLGKSVTSLTGADVAGDKNSANAMQQVKQEVTTDYKNGIAAAVQQTTLELSSLIEQTAEAIRTEVSKKYALGEDVEELVSSSMEQLANSITGTITQLQTRVEEVDGDLQKKFNEITKYFTFDINGLTIGQVNNPNKVVIDNDEVSILVNGVVVQKFDATGAGLIPRLKVTTELNLFGYIVDQDGSGNVNCEYKG